MGFEDILNNAIDSAELSETQKNSQKRQIHNTFGYAYINQQPNSRNEIDKNGAKVDETEGKIAELKAAIKEAIDFYLEDNPEKASQFSDIDKSVENIFVKLVSDTIASKLADSHDTAIAEPLNDALFSDSPRARTKLNGAIDEIIQSQASGTQKQPTTPAAANPTKTKTDKPAAASPTETKPGKPTAEIPPKTKTAKPAPTIPSKTETAKPAPAIPPKTETAKPAPAIPPKAETAKPTAPIPPKTETAKPAAAIPPKTETAKSAPAIPPKTETSKPTKKSTTTASLKTNLSTIAAKIDAICQQLYSKTLELNNANTPDYQRIIFDASKKQDNYKTEVARPRITAVQLNKLIQEATDLYNRLSQINTVLDTEIAKNKSEPTAAPIAAGEPGPAAAPTAAGTPEPTAAPAAAGTPEPAAAPTAPGTPEPAAAPTAPGTPEPAAAPTAPGTPEPTAAPTAAETSEPTAAPIAAGTPEPTADHEEITPPTNIDTPASISEPTNNGEHANNHIIEYDPTGEGYTKPERMGVDTMTDDEWDYAVVTTFGFPFINFSSRDIVNLLRGDDKAQSRAYANIKGQLRDIAKLQTRGLLGGAWDSLMGSPIKLLQTLKNSTYSKCFLNILVADGHAVRETPDGGTLTVKPAIYGSVKYKLNKAEQIPINFINKFYVELNPERHLNIYRKYAGNPQAKDASQLMDNTATPIKSVLAPNKAKPVMFMRSDLSTGSFLSKITGFRKSNSMIMCTIDGRRGGFIIPSSLADTLFAY